MKVCRTRFVAALCSDPGPVLVYGILSVTRTEPFFVLSIDGLRIWGVVTVVVVTVCHGDVSDVKLVIDHEGTIVVAR